MDKLRLRGRLCTFERKRILETEREAVLVGPGHREGLGVPAGRMPGGGRGSEERDPARCCLPWRWMAHEEAEPTCRVRGPWRLGPGGTSRTTIEGGAALEEALSNLLSSSPGARKGSVSPCVPGPLD